MKKIVDTTIASRQLGSLLDEVYYKGETIIIERKGKALAKIVPLESNEKTNKKSLTPKQKQLIDELNSLPPCEIEEEPTDILRKIRENKAEKVAGKYGK